MTTLSASVHEWSVGRRASGFVQVGFWEASTVLRRDLARLVGDPTTLLAASSVPNADHPPAIPSMPRHSTDFFHPQPECNKIEPEAFVQQIISDPQILTGKPTVSGTRISVELILEKLAAGQSTEQLLAAHPTLTAAGIRAAMAFAAQALRADVIYPAEKVTD